MGGPDGAGMFACDIITHVVLQSSRLNVLHFSSSLRECGCPRARCYKMWTTLMLHILCTPYPPPPTSIVQITSSNKSYAYSSDSTPVIFFDWFLMQPQQHIQITYICIKGCFAFCCAMFLSGCFYLDNAYRFGLINTTSTQQPTEVPNSYKCSGHFNGQGAGSWYMYSGWM